MRIVYKYQEGNKTKRVDFLRWYELEKKKQGKNVRPLNLEALRQLEDSLISRNFGLAQRLAILATAQQEMGKEGPASRGIGGNGYLGLGTERMPLKYLNDAGYQIYFLLNDLLTTHQNNWLDGGQGGPYIKNGKEGYNMFYSAEDPNMAAQILNKSYIRPASKSDWYRRGEVAEDMSSFLYKKGNKIHIKKKNRGKFTEYCGGTVTSECIARGKNSPNPAIRKRATFAANARKWKHLNGGILSIISKYLKNEDS